MIFKVNKRFKKVIVNELVICEVNKRFTRVISVKVNRYIYINLLTNILCKSVFNG